MKRHYRRRIISKNTNFSKNLKYCHLKVHYLYFPFLVHYDVMKEQSPINELSLFFTMHMSPAFLIFFNAKILVSFSRNMQNSFNKFSVVKKKKLELQHHTRSEILLALIIPNVPRYMFGKVLLFGFDSDF